MRKSDGESQSYLGVVDVDLGSSSPRTSESSSSSNDDDEKLLLSDTKLQEDIMTMLLHSLNLVSALSLNKGPCEICTEDHPALRCRLLSEKEISAPTRLRLQQLKHELSQKKADKWKQSHSSTTAGTGLLRLSAEELDAKYQAHVGPELQIENEEDLLLPSILKDEETPEQPQEVMPKTVQEQEMVEKLQRQYEQQLQEIRKGSVHMKEKYERQRAIILEDETEEQQVTRRRASVHQEKESERAAAAVALEWSRNLHKSTRNLHTSIMAAQEEEPATMKREHTIDNGSAAVIVADDQSSTPPSSTCMNIRDTLQKYKAWILFVTVAIILCIVVSLLNDAPPDNPDGAYCEENGGDTEYRNEEDGVEYALCVFHDGTGTACDSGAFRRGECDKDSTLIISLYCKENGGNLTNVGVDWGATVGEPPATYQVCTLQDGTECAEHSYYDDGGCAPDLRDEIFLETQIQ